MEMSEHKNNGPDMSGQSPDEAYLTALTSQIRCRKARPLVEEELKAHIQDQKDALMADGMEENAALKESIRQMGDPVEWAWRWIGFTVPGWTGNFSYLWEY